MNNFETLFGTKMGDAPVGPNRATRRAMAKQRKGQQRKAQKAYDRQVTAEALAAEDHERAVRRLIREAAVPAYWNGLPTTAARGTAIVAEASEFPNYWAREEGLIGERIAVVLIDLNGVNAGGGLAYLDNRDGSGWNKVTAGFGSPAYRHAEVSIVPGSFEVA